MNGGNVEIAKGIGVNAKIRGKINLRMDVGAVR